MTRDKAIDGWDNLSVASAQPLLYTTYEIPRLGFHQLYANATLPAYATKDSACFDLAAHLIDAEGNLRVIKSVDPQNSMSDMLRMASDLLIPPTTTVLIPTGLIAKIPSGYSVRVHMRSSVALKRGLILPNGEGVIDADYFDELFLMVRNASNAVVTVKHGERICQGELVQNVRFPIEQIHTRPEQTTDRTGGFGSTGV